MKKRLTFFVTLIFVAVMALSMVAYAASYCITCTKDKCPEFRPASGTKCVCGHDKGAHVGAR